MIKVTHEPIGRLQQKGKSGLISQLYENIIRKYDEIGPYSYGPFPESYVKRLIRGMGKRKSELLKWHRKNSDARFLITVLNQIALRANLNNNNSYLEVIENPLLTHMKKTIKIFPEEQYLTGIGCGAIKPPLEASK